MTAPQILLFLHSGTTHSALQREAEDIICPLVNTLVVSDICKQVSVCYAPHGSEKFPVP